MTNKFQMTIRNPNKIKSQLFEIFYYEDRLTPETSSHNLQHIVRKKA